MKNRPRTAWTAALVTGALALAQAAYSQNGAAPAPEPSKPEVPSALPSVFADFPRPRLDIPALEPVWPERWNSAHGWRGVIISLENPEQFPDGSRTAGYFPVEADSPEYRTLFNEKQPPEKASIVTAGPGGFIYLFRKQDREKPVPRSRRNTADAMFKFASAQEVDLRTGPALVIEQTWFSVYEPRGSPRGLALVSPGLLGTPVGTLQFVSEQLRKEGWLVLRMLCQPSRFTEQVEFELDASADLGAQAEKIARVTDDRAAECAYAVQSAAAWLESQHPGLKALPRVAVGFSGGAMTLPTIIAREPGRYAAAVLVGGGADFWLMNQRSNYRELIRAVKETWSEKPTPETLAQLDEEYLRHASLDSYHTAAALKGKPVLMIQGTADKAVPAPLGDVLWERLGRPERWLAEGATHESLFMNLPRDHFPRMMEWLNRAVPRQDAAEPVLPQGGPNKRPQGGPKGRKDP